MIKRLVAATAVASLGVLAGCGGGSTTEPASNTDTSKQGSNEEKAAKIGDVVKDGKFAFKVTGVKRGRAKVGMDIASKKAQGEFVLISITVKNIAKEPQTLEDSSQRLFDTKGVEYTADIEAGVYVNENNEVLFNEINPGNSTKGVLVYDVPKGTQLSHIELHDSSFSGGVKVSLT